MSRTDFARICAGGALVALLTALTGCPPQQIDCASVPTEDHGVCSPDQPTCAGGAPEPIPDTREDGAIDITQFSRDQIPTGIVLSVPNEGRRHIADDLTPTYAADPPASGSHFPTPAPTGFYCDPLLPGYWVHSLEHGYIVILFDEAALGGQRDTVRTQLNMFLKTAPLSPTFGNVKLVITPYANLPHPICVVAWNRQLFLDSVDEAAIRVFYETYIDQGPELEP